MTFRFALAAQLYNKRFYAIVKSAVVATAMTAESLDSRLPSRRADFAVFSPFRHATLHACRRACAQSLCMYNVSRRADFARSGSSRWRAINHSTCHKRFHVQNRLLSVLNTLLSYTKRNIMLCSLCLTIPFVIFRLIPISSFGKYYDDEEEYKIMSIEF
ncbi:hypothetical protein Tsp_07992 [Trichinella spiralis]|uniref:hypothetical protein n=1 Tax=Trichinella spiralis TaxID=6334 RepID=UPI0001EFDB27|nr:hypothetical protein Tsp_07992 [Trichinella spiralis]